MPTLHPYLAYTMPPECKARVVAGEPLPGDWLSQLIQLTQDNLGSAPFFNLAVRINEHVGSESIYDMKEQLKEGLKAIYSVMVNVKTSTYNKSSIARKLVEWAEYDTPVFHGGVIGIVEGFQRPETLDDLLYRIRRDIVSKTANQTTDEAYGKYRFFRVAQSAGYGVRALNPYEIQKNLAEAFVRDYRQFNILNQYHVYYEPISNDEILKKLAKAFARDYRLFNILSGIEEQINSEMLTLGYTGLRSEDEYDSVALNKCIVFLTTLFKDAPAVVKQQDAAESLHSRERYKQQVNNHMNAGRARLQALISNAKLTPQQAPQEMIFKDSIIKGSIIKNDISPLLKDKYDAFLASLDADSREELAQIQNDSRTFFQNIKPVTYMMNIRQDDLVSPFLLTDDGKTGVDWSQIGQAVWDEFRSKQYFILTAQETAALNALFDRRVRLEYKHSQDLKLSGPEVVALLRMKMLGDDKKQGLVRWYINADTGIYEKFVDRLISLVLIQIMGKQDAAIRSVVEDMGPLIDKLIDKLVPGRFFFEILEKKQCGVAKYLVEHGADVNVKDVNGETALMDAAVHGLFDAVKFLIEHGADVNVKDSRGNTALSRAVGQWKWDVARFLIEHGADVNIEVDNRYNTVLLYAAENKQWDVVKLTIEHGADVNAKNIYGNTLFDYAAYIDWQWGIITLLLWQSASKAVETATLPLVTRLYSILERGLDIQKTVQFMLTMNKIKLLLEGDSGLNDGVLQCYKNLPQEKHAWLFGVIKERLPSIIQSRDDYVVLREFFTPEQRKLAIHVLTLQPALRSISNISTSKHAHAFAAALIRDDHGRIKSQVDALVACAKENKSPLSEIQVNVQLIDILSSLKPFWKSKLISALGLTPALKSKEGVNVGIGRYIEHDSPPNTQKISSDFKEDLQTIRREEGDTPRSNCGVNK